MRLLWKPNSNQSERHNHVFESFRNNLSDNSSRLLNVFGMLGILIYRIILIGKIHRADLFRSKINPFEYFFDLTKWLLKIVLSYLEATYQKQWLCSKRISGWITYLKYYCCGHIQFNFFISPFNFLFPAPATGKT